MQIESFHEDLQPRLSYQQLQPQRARHIPKWKRVLHSIDIFAMIPTPKTYPVSTKRSLIGTFLLATFFLSYVLYSFFGFIFHNVPRINEYSQLDQSTTPTRGPDIAVQFLYGNPFSMSITDDRYFSITMQEVVKYLDPTKADNSSKQIKMVPCYSKDIEWMPQNASNLEFKCPEVPLNLSGQLYQSEQFIYPRIQIDYCPFNHPDKKANCENETEIRRITAGGRLFVYIKNQAPDVNYATGEETKALTYQVFQYFLVPGMYNRAEIVLQKQFVSISGNYLTSFSTKEDNFLVVSRQYLYITNVTQNDANKNSSADLSLYKGFQTWLRLDQEMRVIQVVKVTIVDMISKWGAFWGVLFAGFAFYFLRYNAKRFYAKNPQWAAFDENQAQTPSIARQE